MDCRRGTDVGRSAFTLIELLVVMSIILLLAGMLTAAAFALHGMGMAKAAKADIQAIGVGLAAYRRDFGRFPPDELGQGSSEHEDMNMAMVYYLGTKLQRGFNTYGPYVLFRESKLIGADHSFKQYQDPYGNLYIYAENASHPSPVGHNAKSYDLVTAGEDGQLGGEIGKETGYVDALAPDLQRLEMDNISNWSK